MTGPLLTQQVWIMAGNLSEGRGVAMEATQRLSRPPLFKYTSLTQWLNILCFNLSFYTHPKNAFVQIWSSNNKSLTHSIEWPLFSNLARKILISSPICPHWRPKVHLLISINTPVTFLFPLLILSPPHAQRFREQRVQYTHINLKCKYPPPPPPRNCQLVNYYMLFDWLLNTS